MRRSANLYLSLYVAMTEMFLYKKSFGALRKYAGLQNTANLEPTFFVCSSGSHTLHHAVWKAIVLISFVTAVVTLHLFLYFLGLCGLSVAGWWVLAVALPVLLTIGLDVGAWVEMNIISCAVKAHVFTIWNVPLSATYFMWHPQSVIMAICKNIK